MVVADSVCPIGGLVSKAIPEGTDVVTESLDSEVVVGVIRIKSTIL